MQKPIPYFPVFAFIAVQNVLVWVVNVETFWLTDLLSLTAACQLLLW